MTQQQNINNYKFDNLQPITFLRKFNKMVDQDRKNPITHYRNQLKVFSLSKFPLPNFYQKMEGIFQTGTKKKDLINQHVKSRDDIHDEIFFEKHRIFMGKAIQKMIKDSEQQQQNLQNYKTQYQPNRKLKIKPKKSLSQSKFQINLLSKLNRPTQQKSEQRYMKQSVATTNRHYPKINTQSNALNEQVQGQDQIKKTYLQKVQTERYNSFHNTKKQKIIIKDKNKLSQYLEQQRISRTQRNREKQSNQSQRQKQREQQRQKISYFHNMSVDDNRSKDYKQIFRQNILDLQKQQAKFKEKYSSKIEDQIKKFDEKVKFSIQKTKKQKFW